MTKNQNSSAPGRSPLQPAPVAPDPWAPRAERLAAGRALRERVPRRAHALWQCDEATRDPIALIEDSNRDRLPELIPLRIGRMLQSPFAFLRGAAALMAHDLSTTPSSGLRVQAAGDCHLLNFGLFATPERNLVFDLNDFDETLPAPFEWDLKRLAASVIIAGRDQRIGAAASRIAVLDCVRAYREQLRAYSRRSPLDVWYARLDAATLIALAPDERARRHRERLAEKARGRVIEHLFPKIVGEVAGQHRFLDQPPVLFHVTDAGFDQRVRQGISAYRASLAEDRRRLFDRYRLEDVAMKVVGIGSVGTRCYVALFFSAENHPLVLQIKEARRSALEPYAGPSPYRLQGQRVVMGQRLMQSSSDIFLGWARGPRGRDFYVRQLRDMKLSAAIAGFTGEALRRYAEICGWALARAHAKSGDAAVLSGYMGRSDRFDQAIADFAEGYADQTERDHAALQAAVRTGRVEALLE